jgi:hypothetical protein
MNRYSRNSGKNKLKDNKENIEKDFKELYNLAEGSEGEKTFIEAEVNFYVYF